MLDMMNHNASNKLLLVYSKTMGIAVWTNEDFAFLLRKIFIGWHDRSWTILNGKLTMLELLNIY